MAIFGGGPRRLWRQWRRKIFQKDRTRNRVPDHLLWWKEKWPKLRKQTDSCVVGNGLTVWLEAWRKKDWKTRDKEICLEECV